MIAHQLGSSDGTVTDCGSLYLAMEMHADQEKRRERLTRLPEHLLEKLHHPKIEEEGAASNGFAPQPLLDKLASAALFDCRAPILVRHTQAGALTQFFRCRFLPFLRKTVAWDGIATVSGHEGGLAEDVLARALAKIVPGLDARALRGVPLAEWPNIIGHLGELEGREPEPHPQCVLVIEHFDDLVERAARPAFRQLLRRLARLPGISVIVGEVRKAGRQPFLVGLGWTRPFRSGGSLDLGARSWQAPRCTRFGDGLDRFYTRAGEFHDSLRRRMTERRPPSPAARAATASALVMIMLTLIS